METQKSIWFVTLLLAAVAGYCDTVTFVAADSIFSAHVTGNFIVFAYQIIKGSDSQVWIKLLTFPVFIIAVIIGGQIASRALNRHKILLLEGIVLLISGAAAIAFVHVPRLDWVGYSVVMLVVLAMGLQNAFGKLFAKETYGPTTMMTGNVTQASLDLGSIITSGFKDILTWESLKKQSITIGGFLIGCLLGALMAKNFGLGVIILPGIAMIICYWITNKTAAVQSV